MWLLAHLCQNQLNSIIKEFNNVNFFMQPFSSSSSPLLLVVIVAVVVVLDTANLSARAGVQGQGQFPARP